MLEYEVLRYKLDYSKFQLILEYELWKCWNSDYFKNSTELEYELLKIKSYSD
jgi:hypothetical protein